MFKLLGVVVFLYAAYAASSGKVWAKSGLSGDTISRAEKPVYFWAVVVIYFGLGVALLTVF